ncbi:MAG: 1-(5-phosphoribosyl)-5-((5-phosphoribosylamino)methylideneamino)imidazole-4-carboxamide isomerase [Sulfolobales archaeon]
MRVIPSIDLSNYKAVKRIKGVRNSGLILGDALKVAEELYGMGYDSLHIVDLDAAGGYGNNEDLIKKLITVGFKWVQVGGGIRSIEKANRILSYGASSIVVSTLFYEDRQTFNKLVEVVGGEKVLVAVDYDEDLIIKLKGWATYGTNIYKAMSDINNYDVLGVIFTYIGNEGTQQGVDKRVKEFAQNVKGLKEYAGGITSLDDLKFLKYAGIDYAILGMSIYTGSLIGVKYV